MPANGAPILRYRDASAAVAWLCGTLGFEVRSVVKNKAGVVRLIKLALGDGVVLVVPVGDSDGDKLIMQPDEAGGAETQFSYFFVEDIAAHYERAKAAGAEIVLDHVSTDRGGRGFVCRDPEGHIWSFGLYNPRTGISDLSARSRDNFKRTYLHDVSAALSAVLVVSVAIIGLFYCWGSTFLHSGGVAQLHASTPTQAELSANAKLEEALQVLAKSRAESKEMERQNKELISLLDRQKLQTAQSGRAEQEAIKKLSLERTARETVELALNDAENRFRELRAEKSAAELKSSRPNSRQSGRRAAPPRAYTPVVAIEAAEPLLGLKVFGIQ